MKAIFREQILERKMITYQDIKETFNNDLEKSDESSDEEAKE
jgi:hypothetical protein